jgi:futalosine hydrolase
MLLKPGKKILIVGATDFELMPLIEKPCGRAMVQYGDAFHISTYPFVVEMLITGVGMVPTAAKVTRCLSKSNYDLVINAGICGSFNREIAINELVNVVADSFAETGVFDGVSFTDIFQMGLTQANEFPFVDGQLHAATTELPETLQQLRSVTGVTVNAIHGYQPDIELFMKRCTADVETMEGAACFYASALFSIPALQLRSVSNYVEQRDTAKWDIRGSIESLNQFLIKLLEL